MSPKPQLTRLRSKDMMISYDDHGDYGIRPSLHPTTINAIADALRSRARKESGMVFRVSDTATALDVAITAGNFVSMAIGQRQSVSVVDGMAFTPDEQKVVAGRILGVIMRLDQLEEQLFRIVEQVKWVEASNEWASFGVLKTGTFGLDKRILDDPLFAVTRAECLLALFIDTVEIPQLKKIEQTVPDGSKIDFLDNDRIKVLLTNR